MEAEKDFSGNEMGEKTVIGIRNGVARHPLWRMEEPINLEIKRGEQVAVVGDNAAGKSRLIEVLTGHYPLLLNEVHYDFSPSRLRLASENMKYITFRDSYGEQDGAYYYQQRWNQHDIADDMPTAGALLHRNTLQFLAMTANIVCLVLTESIFQPSSFTITNVSTKER